ncbi:hypothetical protein KBX73_03080 [Acetobacter persici]|uniref:hypothetical protein n=1 Tax=Acetobacter persici TaxID=1076596 RepID=UPI0020CEA557|nr:hypothetical protein [Acetobacter persici]MCP9318774.1 hypothetical protein [Acetobacter persici]
MKYGKNNISYIFSIFVFIIIYYAMLSSRLFLKNLYGVGFYPAVKSHIFGLIFFVCPLIQEVIFCFLSSKTKIKFLSYFLEFITPIPPILWFCYQAKYGQGTEGAADINEFSPFFERLFASFYENGPLIISIFLVRYFYFRKDSPVSQKNTNH